MERRSALKQLAILTGGIIFMPSCTLDPEKASIALNNLKVNEDQEKLLAQIVDAIIPTTDVPGAADMKVHDYVWAMVDDCMEKEEQEIFIKGLDQFNPFTREQTGKNFIKSSPSEREEVMNNIIDNSFTESETEYNLPELKGFLTQTRKLTIEGYMSSQYILTAVHPYVLVPGKFVGCQPLTSNTI